MNMSKADNLIGYKFGKLKVLSRVENTSSGKTRWLCKCDCGNTKVVTGGGLKSGDTTSCGCSHYEKSTLIDLKGAHFGRLVVLKKDNSKIGIVRWLCECECGNYVIVPGRNLREGKTKSCGCLRRDLAKTRATKHGLCGEKLYNIYAQMKRRCNKPSCKDYKWYGGKGIKICDEWKEAQAFYIWAVNNGYRDGLSIDRIDSNKNYSPDNCRWITISENAQRAQLKKVN